MSRANSLFETTGLRQLQELALRQGIQPSFLDMHGQRHEASPETLRAVLGGWGISAKTPRQVRDALLEDEQRRWRQVLPLVIVAWDNKPVRVQLHLPRELETGAGNCRVQFEDGRRKNIPWQPDRLRTLAEAEVDGRIYSTRRLSLPALPFGYHELELEVRGRIHRSLVISAPTKSYTPPGGLREWGLFLPLYAAHSEQSWGAGNLGDWQELMEWLASLGGSVAATLPLLASFLDAPYCESSPYSPASRLLWNEFYLDIRRVRELSKCKAAQRLVGSAPFQQRLEQFRRSEFIDYRAEMAARREVLELLAQFFFTHPSRRRAKFERFLQEHPRAADYAEFRAAGEQTNAPWQQWEERMRHGKLQRGDYSEKAKEYHLYVQWLAQEQITALVEAGRARGVQLHLDLPLGVHPSGYDLWREREAFAYPASVGAPPDMFFTKGQNWGFAPLHPQRIRERGYRYVLEYLRFQMRHTGLLRLDHVMCLHRLYWIPPGFPATAGAYVTYPAEELHAILSLESQRHETILVGENLGTVPPEVNAAMTRHQLRQTYVLQFEQSPDPKRAVRPPPMQSAAGINTHDMPTFAAHWQGLDLKDRAALGLIAPGELGKEQQRRRRLNVALVKFLQQKGWLKTDQPDVAAALGACLAWLGAGPAEIVLANLEDLWQETQPQNVPGTCTERPNWRRKARRTLEEIRNSPEVREMLAQLDSLR